MKNLNIVFKIIIIVTTLQENLIPGFTGRTAEQQSAATQASVYQGITANFSPTAGSGSTTCCGTGSSCQSNPTSGYIPQFYVQILGGTAPSYTPLNGTSGIPMLGVNNTNFAVPYSMLTVHIFPPSNIVSGSTITTSTDDLYVAFFTLKDFSGNNIYKQVQTFKSSSFPHYIGISGSTTAPSTTTGTTSDAAYFIASQTNADYVCIGTIFPPRSISKMTLAEEQTVINGINPIVQNFLFTMNSNQITVTHISGGFGSESSSSFKLGKSLSFSPIRPTTLGSDALQPLNISFNDNGNPTSDSILLSFTLPDTNPKIPFTASDLASGLILDVVIFPATTSGTGNYSVVATIKTLDGTKLRKKYSINSTYNQNPSAPILNSLPTSITLSQGDASAPTTILTSNILSSAAVGSPQYFNFISPLNLSFIISQPTGSNSLQALMI